jgi:membrane-associated phospholipid phosphatase
MTRSGILFWQPKFDFLNYLQSTSQGRLLIIILNYLIWIFMFITAFLLVNNDINSFWQILIATIFGETIEKIIKSKVYWNRPMFKRHHQVPSGLVKSWYSTGSFPSGHTLKTTFFFLFVLQYSVANPALFLIITMPLLIFRVLVGFHYPIDLIGGAAIGVFTWLITRFLVFPDSLNQIVSLIFNTIF